MSVGKESTNDSDWRKFKGEAMTWFEPLLSWVYGEQTDLPFALDRTMIIVTEGRCYFNTVRGEQGLCYPTTQPQDESWVIDGSNVPFVLRRTQLSNEEKAELRPSDAYGVGDSGFYGVKADFKPGQGPYGYYRLVGDCYLDDYMYGRGDESEPHHILLV